MEIYHARKLNAVAEVNRKLNKLLAESMLDASTLKEMLGKTLSPSLRDELLPGQSMRSVTCSGGPAGCLDYSRRPIAMPYASGRWSAANPAMNWHSRECGSTELLTSRRGCHAGISRSE